MAPLDSNSNSNSNQPQIKLKLERELELELALGLNLILFDEPELNHEPEFEPKLDPQVFLLFVFGLLFSYFSCVCTRLLTFQVFAIYLLLFRFLQLFSYFSGL